MKLGMKRADINALYAKFVSFDVNHDNRVDLDEMVVITSLTCVDLLKLIFRLFDRDMSGGLTFYEFVLGMYNFIGTF